MEIPIKHGNPPCVCVYVCVCVCVQGLGVGLQSVIESQCCSTNPLFSHTAVSCWEHGPG